MVKMLIDTCVISEVRRPQGDARVRTAFERLATEDIYFSVVTIGEVTKGLALLDPGRRRAELEAWLFEIETMFDGRILPIDLDIARIWGQESARYSREGLVVSDADGLIAATAIRYRMSVMTRNVRHFRAASVEIVNPWEM
jgi:predicted nucleic acid-binding protein